jgi:hypothetical protein
MAGRTVSAGYKSTSLTCNRSPRSAEEIDPSREVQDLTWDFLDGQATDCQFRRLEELLRGSTEARRIYVNCVQLHVDLYFLVGGEKPPLPITVAAGEETQVKSPFAPPPVAPDALPAGAAESPPCGETAR